MSELRPPRRCRYLKLQHGKHFANLTESTVRGWYNPGEFNKLKTKYQEWVSSVCSDLRN